MLYTVLYITHVCYIQYYTLHMYVYTTLHMYIIIILHYTCMLYTVLYITHVCIYTHSAPGRVEGVEIKSRGVNEVHVTWQPLPSASITTYLVELSAGGRPYKLANRLDYLRAT